MRDVMDVIAGVAAMCRVYGFAGDVSNVVDSVRDEIIVDIAETTASVPVPSLRPRRPSPTFS